MEGAKRSGIGSLWTASGYCLPVRAFADRQEMNSGMPDPCVHQDCGRERLKTAAAMPLHLRRMTMAEDKTIRVSRDGGDLPNSLAVLDECRKMAGGRQSGSDCRLDSGRRKGSASSECRKNARWTADILSTGERTVEEMMD